MLLLRCPHCHHVQQWIEGSTAVAPNGDVAAGPEHESEPAKVDAFLIEHPAAVGMVMA